MLVLMIILFKNKEDDNNEDVGDDDDDVDDDDDDDEDDERRGPYLWNTISPIPSVRVTIGPLVQTLTRIYFLGLSYF